MLDAFYEYISDQLSEKLSKRKVVVFYDPRAEFEPFFEGLKVIDSIQSGLSQVRLGGKEISLARYRGSFFALRSLVEPLTSDENPEPLIIYISGLARDHKMSPLMELEEAGITYEPQLRRLARQVLLNSGFADDQIDGLLDPKKTITYDDIVDFLKQARTEEPSVLRAVFRGSHGENLIMKWLSSDEYDVEITNRKVVDDLRSLLSARLGLQFEPGLDLPETRNRTFRFILVNELRLRYPGDAPEALEYIGQPPLKEQRDRILLIARNLRERYPDQYIEAANRVETEVKFPKLDPTIMNNADTFGFQERLLLTYVNDLIVQKRFSDAVTMVDKRIESFWVSRDASRGFQWKASNLMAELGERIEAARGELPVAVEKPEAWVDRYTEEDGWFEIDTSHRRLEYWVARMGEEPESYRALNVVRNEYEDLLRRMADGFFRAFHASNWSVPGVRHQTEIYSSLVEPKTGKVAYFLIDAMRYEMGVELARRLEQARDLVIEPVVAALPTVTPIGMAALMPGASSSFSVVARRDKLAAIIDETPLSNSNDRKRLLESRVPDSTDFTLSKLIDMSKSRLQTTINDASLVVVRSQEIDAIGEGDGGHLARQFMGMLVDGLIRAVKKLSAAGIEHFIITADHGHLFGSRKDDDMKISQPGGDTLELHRRCWIGYGGITPGGTKRVLGADLGYDTDLEFLFPTGLGVFKAGGDLSYHHGGASLQELIVPAISFRLESAGVEPEGTEDVRLDEIPDEITNRTFGIHVKVESTILPKDPLFVKATLMSGQSQVGEVGLVFGAELDPDTRVIQLERGSDVNLGLLLTRDDVSSIRIVIVDAATDALIVQSDDIPVRLGR